MTNWYKMAQNYSWAPRQESSESSGEVIYMLNDMQPEYDKRHTLTPQLAMQIQEWAKQVSGVQQFGTYDSVTINYNFNVNTQIEDIQHGVHHDSISDSTANLAGCSGIAHIAGMGSEQQMDTGMKEYPLPTELCSAVVEELEEVLTED